MRGRGLWAAHHQGALRMFWLHFQRPLSDTVCGSDTFLSEPAWRFSGFCAAALLWNQMLAFASRVHRWPGHWFSFLFLPPTHQLWGQNVYFLPCWPDDQRSPAVKMLRLIGVKAQGTLKTWRWYSNIAESTQSSFNWILKFEGATDLRGRAWSTSRTL